MTKQTCKPVKKGPGRTSLFQRAEKTLPCVPTPQ
jgi:hypothetical protein